MKKITTLIIAFVVLSLQNAFAGSNAETAKAQFQFTSVELTQNSWDYAMLHFNVNDQATGENLDIPSFLINYEIKDKAGMVISKGSGLYINTMDAKMGSQEDYTISVYTMINGQKISKSICKKASPKKLSMKVDINGASIESGALANDKLSYSFTRPKFSNPNETEDIQIDAANLTLNIALANNTYKIDAGSNHTKVADQASFQNLKNDLKKLTKGGKDVQMTVEPVLVYKGEVYTDNQSYYDVTASGITEINSLEAVASK